MITLTKKEIKYIERIHGTNFEESDIPALWRKRKKEAEAEDGIVNQQEDESCR